jgi:4-amino-4-deoxy-L-arabinose transferase-like glycosyltransferase
MNMQKLEILKKECFWLTLILVLGAFLRLWQIEAWQYLTYDQARDFLIIKKMMVDGKLTLVGPTLSIAPGFFLPPFYYYSLIPFLWLFHFRIVGPDVYTALFGIASIYVFYLLARDLFGKFPALISSFVFALNPYLIHTARHAWNPNTLPFFLLLFALSVERYLLAKKTNYLWLAIFSLSWAIGLHLTAIAFLPMAGLLVYKTIKEKGLLTKQSFSFLSPLIIGLPLVAFDLRHRFPITRAGLAYLFAQKGGELFLLRILEMFFDFLKAPVVLISGLFQDQNLTIRPSNISPFSQVSLFSRLELFEGFKLVLAGALVLFCAWAFFKFYQKNSLQGKLIVSLLSLGFLPRLFFPVSSFYFYYYLVLSPFIFLGIAALVVYLQEKKALGFSLAILVFAVLSLLPRGIFWETHSTNYFLPACEIIANGAGQKPVAIVASVSDLSRWEKNGLEYRYFLETKYKLPLQGWDIKDYSEAEVLYFIDEKGTEDPLNFGGMEMESFAPKKIVDFWEVKTGQKVYKLIR